MGITPGKWGELLKSFLIKKKIGIKIIETAPIVLAERFTDIGSLLIIVMLGAVIFNYGLELVVFITIGFLIIYFLIISKKILEKIIYKLSQFKFFKSLEFTNEFIDVTYILMAPKPFLIMTIFSLTSWFFECFGFYIILSNFEVDISLNWTSFSYALATLISSLTFLPGGIGATEGSLTYLLIQRGMIESDAVVSVFILRLVTLWFSVVVGAVTLAFYNKTENINISKILSEGVNNGKV